MLKDRVILRTLYGAISFSGTIVELLGGEIDGVDTSDLGISCEFGWNAMMKKYATTQINAKINENMSEDYIHVVDLFSTPRGHICMWHGGCTYLDDK